VKSSPPLREVTESIMGRLYQKIPGGEALHVENGVTFIAGLMNPDASLWLPPGELAIARDDAAVGFLPPAFRGLTRLAASACQAPFASIVLTGVGEAWCSLDDAVPVTAKPPHEPFSAYTLQASELFEVPDTALDQRFRDSARGDGASAVRFYAGCALRTADGDVLGTLAVYDNVPRQLSAEQRATLGLLVEQGVTQAELRARLAEHALISGLEPPKSSAPSDATLPRAWIESAPVAIYHTDATGNLTYVNTAYRQIFGLTPEQDLNDWAQGVHPDDRARMERAWSDFCAGPRPMRFEYRTDPQARGVRFFAEQVVAAAGASGFLGTITDVTDLVTARGNLERAETLFRDTVAQAPIGIAYADRHGTFLNCNQAFCAMLHFDLGELQARSIVDLTYSDDVASTSRELERLWSGEADFVDIEKRYTRKDGSNLWVRVTTSLVREGNAAPERSVEFLRDISVRKNMAAELLQQQTLLEAVITDLPLALLACDVTGHITHHNRAAAALHCIPTEHPSVQGSPDPQPLASEVYLADGVTPVSEADHPLARALRGETINNLELVIVPRATTPRTILSSARRLIGPGGQVLGAVAVIQDTTDRKLADLELERVHKQLMTASRQAGMAEIATNVLHNVGNILNSVNISLSLVVERVKQSNAPGLSRVATLLQEKGQLVGTFITSDERGKQIPTYLATLGQQLVTDQKMALQELASLRDNLEHIKSTVAMQQNYARRCGVTETVEVAELVEDSVRLNAGAFVRHGVTLSREFADVPPITVDKHKVLQILVNLVRNAKYACDESGRADKLVTLRVEREINAVRISVLDNGVGISAENMGRLFTHGFTTRQSGHGFGLHSSALAAHELGGSLRAESGGAGCGAVFILDLPLVPPEGRGA
jgi:PAS domain S-box-containing protein